MEWVLRHSKKLSAHSYLGEILQPLKEELQQYKWLLSDLDYITHLDDLPIDLEKDFFLLESAAFGKLLNNHIQFIWGVIIAFPENKQIKVDPEHLPFVEGNPAIFKPGNIQMPGALIEIDCVDSSYTFVKFRDEHLSRIFKNYFPEAILLEGYKWK